MPKYLILRHVEGILVSREWEEETANVCMIGTCLSISTYVFPLGIAGIVARHKQTEGNRIKPDLQRATLATKGIVAMH